MNHLKRVLLTAAAIAALFIPRDAQVIKVGSIAPDRSPWNDALKEVARQWQAISGGTVQLKIYPGSIAGNEEDMIRKMRGGLLGGAVLTNIGLNKIDPDVYVLSSPLLFDSEAELHYVLDRIKPAFEKQINDKGFTIVIWTMSGWVNFFTKQPVLLPEDLKKNRISFSVGEPEMEQALKKMGYQVVPNDLKDLMMGLQSGMVDAFYLPPLLAGSGQYFAQAPHMCSLKVAPLLGGLVIVKRIWEKIPESQRLAMLKAVDTISAKLDRETSQLEKEAIASMVKHGLVIHNPSPESIPHWKETAARGMDELVGKAYSREIYEQVYRLLNEFRQKNAR